MVSWGQNTTHLIGSSGSTTPATSAFGAPSPAPTTTFGAPAPSGGLFGGISSTPAAAPAAFGSPAPAGGLFGTSTSSTGGFLGSNTGAAPAPSSFFGGAAPSTNLFGRAPAPSTGLFGATAPSPFGFPQQQQQQQQGPQIPAQAALQAHMDASARQEEQRVCTALEKIHRAYQGTASATETKSADFTSVVYNPATPQIRQEQWLRGIGVGGQLQPIALPRPPQFCPQDWDQANIRNPDRQNYMPVASVGAAALLARASSQQEQVTASVGRLDKLQETQDMLRERHQDSLQRLAHANRRKVLLSQRLLDVMRQVEIVRCLNHPLQQGELEATKRLQELLHHQVDRLKRLLEQLQQRSLPAVRPTVTDIPADEESLRRVLTQQREMLAQMATVVQQDQCNVALVQQSVMATTASTTHRR